MKKFDLENFLTSESAKKMLSYVFDGFYDKSYVGKWLFQVMGVEYDNALEIVEDLPAQFFPETATWGLAYHEIKWGLPVRPNLSYEERRQLICQKRDYRAPMTPYRMEEYLKNVFDFEIHVEDCHDMGMAGYVAGHPNMFRVTFVGEGTLNAKKAREMLDKIKQSHTTYSMVDMVMEFINSKDLERVFVSGIEVYACFYFFAKLLNGGWSLDGSSGLNQMPICEVAMGVAMGAIRAAHEINVSCALSISAVVAVALPGSQCSMGIGCGFEAGSLLDVGRENVSISVPVCMGARVNVDEVTIEKDLWLLDGKAQMDGLRILDADVWKESL